MSQSDLPSRRQGTYWIGTVPNPDWIPCLPNGCLYIRGQLEQGETGLVHYQLFFILGRKASLAAVRSLWSPVIGHWELTRSKAAEDYCWKEDTRIGEPFEFGSRPFNRNSKADWQKVKELACAGRLEQIEPDVFIRYYGNLCRIRADFIQPVAMDRMCAVFWGQTNTGKSHRAWSLAGDDSYSKDPRTKFWCGYKYQDAVVVDEFRGTIDVSHILRWLDRYPVRVEVKGGSMPLSATKFYITSNLHPREWYPDLDPATFAALERRIKIYEVTSKEQLIEIEQ